MDRVTTEQRDTIKKTSSDRLRARLEQAGWSSGDVAGLDRDQLMEAVAELYVVPTAEAPVVEAPVNVPVAESLAAKELQLREREIALRERKVFAQKNVGRKKKLLRKNAGKKRKQLKKSVGRKKSAGKRNE